ILDTLIETEIEGRKIEDVIRLPRDYVRNQDTVWVMKDDQLEIREIQIVFRDAKYAYIREGIEAGEEIVTTTLATVANGVGLRKITDDETEVPEDSDEAVDSDETEETTE
ncbi:MAG: efflux transporter periplasmic adaptor subunit, partial [Rhodopirellula sp. JB055]